MISKRFDLSWLSWPWKYYEDECLPLCIFLMDTFLLNQEILFASSIEEDVLIKILTFDSNDRSMTSSKSFKRLI